ncbi:membrane-spanning 4-domains subfamily A member 15-like [Heterodontus francisci]|uniref:membrane-spanning 4-domains subfamily A member 15-like n=1 Tax=Heterodontus francisci TaxID=7792 RepID=UPI00355B87FB
MSSERPQTVAVTVTHLYRTESSSPGTPSPAAPPTAYTQKFLEGEPKALGVTQVMIGLVEISFGVPLVLTPHLGATSFAASLVMGIVFIVSGALSIAAGKNPHIKLLRACLAMNIISSFLAACGVVIYIVNIAMTPECISMSTHCEQVGYLYSTIYYTLVVLLIFTILEFTVSIVISAFVCKSTRCCHAYSSMPVILLESGMTDEQ